MKTSQFRISKIRIHIPMTKITLNLMYQNFHYHDHAESTIPTYQESLISFIS